MGRRLDDARARAFLASHRTPMNWESLRISPRKDKRFSIISPAGKTIHFGFWSDAPSWVRSVKNQSGCGTFIDHGDSTKRAAWRARFAGLRNSSRDLAVLDPESPLYYSWNLLW